MSAWGYRLYEDDTFCEITEMFQKEIRRGASAEELSAQIRREYAGDVDFCIVQLAVAECRWRSGEVAERDIAEVRRIIESGADSAYWEELGADARFLQNRRRELEGFLTRIAQPPARDQMWDLQAQPPRLRKGDCFWYKAKGAIYGAVVLEIQTNEIDYYLIALTEELSSAPRQPGQILLAKLYTIAWFGVSDLLSQRRMHGIGNIFVGGTFQNRYGLQIVPGRSVHLSNCGQPLTWVHRYRCLAFPDALVRDFVT